MPSRLIREGILTSDRIDMLDAAEEVFYRRLMSKVDDHGLFDARPSVLRTSLYPLRVDRVREADCSRWMAACQKAGLIALYTCDGKPYLQMLDTRWTARSTPKYPLPPGFDGAPLKTPENKGEQQKTPVPVFGVVGVVEDAFPSATRLPKNFEPEPEPEAEAGIDRASVLASFRDHWTSRPGKAGESLDWQAQWRIYARNAYRKSADVARQTVPGTDKPDPELERLKAEAKRATGVPESFRQYAKTVKVSA